MKNINWNFIFYWMDKAKENLQNNNYPGCIAFLWAIGKELE